MSPSGPLVTLYSEDIGVDPSNPAVDSSQVKAKPTFRLMIGADEPENAHPNTNIADTQSVSSSSNGPRISPITTPFAPFLEMEQEETKDEDDDSNKMFLEGSSLNVGGTNDESTTVDTAEPVVNRGPLEEEKKEDDDQIIVGTNSLHALSNPPVRIPSCVQPVGLYQNVTSCGKRQRNDYRVSFAPATQLTPVSFKFLSNNVNGSRRSYRSKTLVQIRVTLHSSEYTDEERKATWYTCADLKSFKRERKITARAIEKGLLPLPFSSLYGTLPPNDEELIPSDIYVDTISSPVPTFFCSRGVENCTETVSRIRYRHIVTGWNAVFNLQKKHRYELKKLKSLSASEHNQYRRLASLLGGRRSKSSRRLLNGWFSNGTNSKRRHSFQESPRSSQPDPFEDMCCPYDLAAAYLPSSEASVEIARNRAICDERSVAVDHANGLPDREEERTLPASKPNNSNSNSNTAVIHSNPSAISLNSITKETHTKLIAERFSIPYDPKLIIRTMDV